MEVNEIEKQIIELARKHTDVTGVYFGKFDNREYYCVISSHYDSKLEDEITDLDMNLFPNSPGRIIALPSSGLVENGKRIYNK